ncbi:monovalent cation/H(+) antiporter subunit G [Georgenia alba]|uniref:Monovalent cation/H(+) antiporter subunit G n=1 Tax=Georgenia alba TaxID=2233858 RepID=A0ABW2Q7H2_9MICO
MTWTDVADLAGAVLMLLGSLLALVAAIGLVRFPDLLTRMHAATKPQTLGLMLLMGGLALSVREAFVVWTLLLVVACQLVTAPISAHMVGRAGYRTRRIESDQLVVDQLTDDLEKAAKLSDEEVARRLGARRPRP